jgi:subtilisin family serine protease
LGVVLAHGSMGCASEPLAGEQSSTSALELDLPSDDDFYFGGQWALRAIDAPGAWALGQRGRGVRVAVLDTGVDPTHPDLAGNVNTALARSFVPGQTWDVSQDAFPERDHGTHVAGIIAAADNGFGVIGVAPEAEIVPIQVLPRPGGHGPPEAVIEGIYYAASIGAQVINLSVDFSRSLRGGINDRGTDDPTDDVAYTPREAAALLLAFARATSYAHRKGATLVASGGNDGVDADRHPLDLVLPRDAPHVLGIAATGPLGWGEDQAADPYQSAFYTNYGASAIDLAGPGGNVDFELVSSGKLCTVGQGPLAVTLPCWLFDGVVSAAPLKGGLVFDFRSGTSMATAHVSGVAALIIGQAGGALDPERVAKRLRRSALDLGKHGRDDYYGYGFVNAARAVAAD